jgi:hypothetical protein
MVRCQIYFGNVLLHFTPHPSLPPQGGGLACLPVGRGGGDVTLFITFVLIQTH